MFLVCDVKALEWYSIVWFAQDAVGMQEIIDNVDQHTENQQRFDLPSRGIAKIFVFRLIYGGTEYSYVMDPDFSWVSDKPKYWRKVIDEFYLKYDGIKRKHDEWVFTAQRDGKLIMPTGRTFFYKPYQDKRGNWKWPRTTILNYPVQGTGHDLVTLIRVLLWKAYNELPADVRLGIRFCSTVHDSIVFDLRPEHLGVVKTLLAKAFRDAPSVFSRAFNCDFNLPLRYELEVGDNLSEMTPEPI